MLVLTAAFGLCGATEIPARLSSFLRSGDSSSPGQFFLSQVLGWVAGWVGCEHRPEGSRPEHFERPGGLVANLKRHARDDPHQVAAINSSRSPRLTFTRFCSSTLSASRFAARRFSKHWKGSLIAGTSSRVRCEIP